MIRYTEAKLMQEQNMKIHIFLRLPFTIDKMVEKFEALEKKVMNLESKTKTAEAAPEGQELQEKQQAHLKKI